MGKEKKHKKESTESANQKITDLNKLSKKELIDRAKKFSTKFCVGDGSQFQLQDYNTNADLDLNQKDKKIIKENLQVGVDALSTMQDILYAQDKWSLLIVFQAMDAAGKDGAIKHVMSGVNPQGCKYPHLKLQVLRTSITTSCGVAKNIYLNADASESLIVPIMKKF